MWLTMFYFSWLFFSFWQYLPPLMQSVILFFDSSTAHNQRALVYFSRFCLELLQELKKWLLSKMKQRKPMVGNYIPQMISVWSCWCSPMFWFSGIQKSTQCRGQDFWWGMWFHNVLPGKGRERWKRINIQTEKETRSITTTKLSVVILCNQRVVWLLMFCCFSTILGNHLFLSSSWKPPAL